MDPLPSQGQAASRPVARAYSSDMRNGATMPALMRALSPVVTVVSRTDATSEGDTGGDEEGDAAKAAAEASDGGRSGSRPGVRLRDQQPSDGPRALGLMSYEHGLAQYAHRNMSEDVQDLQNAAGYLVGRSIDEEIVRWIASVEVLQISSRAIKEADAAVRTCIPGSQRKGDV